MLLGGLCGAGLLASPCGADAQDLTHWTAVWATALQEIPQDAALLGGQKAPDIGGKTVRQIIYPSLGGDTVRLHVSNRYGTDQLDILQATFAKAAGDGAALADPALTLTFNGRNELHLAPGGEAASDPLKINLVGHKPYAVSLYLGAHQGLQAWHRIASQVNFISIAGDYSGDADGAAYHQPFSQFAWITSLAVADAAGSTAAETAAPAAAPVTAPGTAPAVTPIVASTVAAAFSPGVTLRVIGGVLAIGDSITDGSSSTVGLNHRWPDELSRRIALDGKTPLAVLNAGIAGNRLLSPSPCFGDSLGARFEGEITGHAGVATAIVLIGINDINFAAAPPQHPFDCGSPYRQVSAESLIAGYRRLIDVAHRHQVRLLLGTLTPGALPADREEMRQAVNRWIRSGTGFDGIVDFDAALRDPAQPAEMQAAYDSGDHLHPSDAGYAAMAAAVPLNLLAAPTGAQLTASQETGATKVQ